MKVYVQPRGIHSRAMARIANALTRYRPLGVTLTTDINAADLVVMYVIGPDALQAGRDILASGRRYIAVQCCVETTGVGVEDWLPFWQGAELVMSYYDLSRHGDFNFYHAPLGLDDAFLQPFDLSAPREPLCVTTGYCDGQHAEAISEVWQACSLVGLRCFHVGPTHVEGMNVVPENWTAQEGVTDEGLASLYRRARWVASMRHREGLELPAAEGLSCGARPILFNQPALRHWYGNSSIYMTECSGDKLVSSLVAMFEMMGEPPPVDKRERRQIAKTFNWETICTEFWRRLLT